MNFTKIFAYLAAGGSLAAADFGGVKNASNRASGGVGAGGGSGPRLEVRDKEGFGGDTDYGTDCSGVKTLPFMVTNVALTEDGDEHYFGWYSNDDTDEMRFLTNVRYCDGGWTGAYRIYGTPVTTDEYKNAVEEEVSTNPAVDHVLYNFHGVTLDPKAAFMGGSNFMENHPDTGYLLIPIHYRSYWQIGTSYVSYERSRNMVPEAGHQLAAKFDAFKTSVPTSVMAHSMGCWVYRVFAQNIENPEVVFDNNFLVACDARMDMFGTDFNPAAPRDAEAGNAETAVGYLAVPEEELRENGGLALTQLAGHTTVVWNSADISLEIREAFQVGAGPNVREALGKFGGEAEALMTLPYFQERVTFRDFSDVVPLFHGFLMHNYQWLQEAVDLYVELKSGEDATPTTAQFNSLRGNGYVQ